MGLGWHTSGRDMCDGGVKAARTRLSLYANDIEYEYNNSSFIQWYECIVFVVWITTHKLNRTEQLFYQGASVLFIDLIRILVDWSIFVSKFEHA